ncbi:MAG: ABC transporter permease [Nocardioidaceae bacterium]|nr:ABC transporter permease [Nocardioidaceae bacterium]
MAARSRPGPSSLAWPHFVLRGHQPRWLTPVAMAAAVVFTVALTAIPIRLAGANPPATFERYLVRPLSTQAGVFEVLLTATPLIFTGLAVAIAFRAGYWNIGAEGQFLAGAICVTWVGTTFSDLPGPLAIPLGFVAGAAGGLTWAIVPALLKRRAGIDEVVTTLLLNPVALLVVQGLLNGPWRNSKTGFTDSDRLGPGFDLPILFSGSRAHLGLIVGLVLLVIAWWVLARTPLGLGLTASGLAPATAEFSGIPVKRLQFGVALVSGGVAGMGGASQVMGVQHQLTQGISNSYGYTGVIIATLGGLTALGVLLVALLLGDISVGAQNASLVLQLPPQLGQVFGALLLLSVLAALSWRRYRLEWRRRP